MVAAAFAETLYNAILREFGFTPRILVILEPRHQSNDDGLDRISSIDAIHKKKDAGMHHIMLGIGKYVVDSTGIRLAKNEQMITSVYNEVHEIGLDQLHKMNKRVGDWNSEFDRNEIGDIKKMVNLAINDIGHTLVMPTE